MAASTTAVTAGLSLRKWARITSPHLKLHNPKTRWPILLTFVMKQMFQGNNWQIGKFRWSVTNNKKPVNFGHPQNIAELLAIEPEQRDDKQKKVLNDYYRTQDTGLQQRTKAVAEAKKPLPTDPRLQELEAYLASTQKPLVEEPKLTALKRAVDLSTKQLSNKRLYGAQDIAWAPDKQSSLPV